MASDARDGAQREGGHGVSARDLSLAGLLGAAGIALPFVFHLFGPGLGRVLLPMYLPIMAAGLLVSPGLAAVVGLTTPLLSALLTGMPPLAPPIAFLMSLELGAAAPTAGFLYRRLRFRIVGAILGESIVGRLVLAAEVAVLGAAIGLNIPWWKYVGGAIGLGLPGLALQLIILPPLVVAIEKRRRAQR